MLEKENIKEKIFYIFVYVFILINIALSIYLTYLLINKNKKQEEIVEQTETVVSEEVETTTDEKEIQKYVEIKGQVKNPGVYAIIDGNIINDIIEMAGGLTTKAYTKNVNLSKKVEDEMVIYIYSKSEISSINSSSTISTCSCPTYDITTCVSQKESTITVGNSSNESSTSEDNTLININTDSLEKLMTLSGIGEAKAKNIIEYREANGNFKTIEDIQNVSGISTNIYEKIKDYITV